MKIPETDNKNKSKQNLRKSFLEKLKDHSKTSKINIVNLLFSHINQNGNINNKAINPDENNNNILPDNNLIKQTEESSKERKETKGRKNNNISNENGESEEKFNNKNNKKKTSLSKRNIDIFAHLIQTEQNKILNYYRNPVLFTIKKMCEGIIFHDNHNDENEDNKENAKDGLSEIEEINLEENNINENIGEERTKNRNKVVKKKKRVKKKLPRENVQNIIIDDN